MARPEEIGVHATQAALFAQWREAVAKGSSRLGWKVGINDPKAKRFYGLSDSVVGYMTHESIISETHDIHESLLIMAEPELAIRIDREVGPEIRAGDAKRAIGAVSAALEVLSFDQPRQTLEEVMGHNIFHLGVCLGDWIDPDAAERGKVSVRKNGRAARAASFDDALPPLEEIVTLIATTLNAHGERLNVGDVIISGAMTSAIPLETGHQIEADFEGLGRVGLMRPSRGRVQCLNF